MKSQREAPITRDAVCPAHGPYLAQNLHGEMVWTRCPVCAQQREAEEAAQRAAEQSAADAAMLRYRIAASGLQGRFLKASFANFEATLPPQRQAHATCRSFAEDFGSTAPTGGLWLIGPPGTGKTHLASAMVSHLIREHALDAHILAVHELTRMARARIGNKRQDSTIWAGTEYTPRPDAKSETVDGFIERLACAALLVLDEIGVSRGSDWETEQLFAVVDARYKAELPTVVVSNLSAVQLKTELGHRLYDRLREGAKQVPMTWASHRGAA